MAKAAKIFATQSGSGTSTVYTVPVGKYVVFSIFNSSGSTGCSLIINSVPIAVRGAGSDVEGNLKGVVAPAGTTIGITLSGGAAIITGFEYDV